MNDDLFKTYDILLVEDNPGDVRLVQEALKEGRKNCRLSVVKDGEEASLFLAREGEYYTASTPAVIILDLNIPKKDGREVLHELKTDEKLKNIPVIVLTSSEAEDDIEKAYSLGANCYINKPADLDRYVYVIKLIEEFWLGVVKLPEV